MADHVKEDEEAPADPSRDMVDIVHPDVEGYVGRVTRQSFEAVFKDDGYKQATKKQLEEAAEVEAAREVEDTKKRKARG